VFVGVADVVVAKTCGFEISTAALFTNPLLIEFDGHPIAFVDGLFDADDAATTAELVIWSRIAWYELNICFIIVDDFNAWKSCSVLLLVDSPLNYINSYCKIKKSLIYNRVLYHLKQRPCRMKKSTKTEKKSKHT
jgi:hypothetical protein